ncbi:hypothetical protein COU57_05465 [Candidatus Pacearchaeota archaeon CG10_big_fil_rev_8_21_14_0_10_32_14]|nr:MAG: hypothetical protein COU57_05465 [Candidatus Pacearchaeota archaeon CG10_big_fil_rev_8_21_14_0_10_32_14]
MTYIKRLVMYGFKSFPRKTEIPFDKEINVILGPNGSGKCITGDSVVALGDGSFERIDKIVNSRLDKAIKTEDGFLIPGDGTEIECLNLETQKIETKMIKSYVKRTSPETLLSIKTRSGKQITATKYHPLFILKNGKVVEARADELKPGVRIATPRKINYKPEGKYFIELLNEISVQDNIYAPFKEDYILILNSIKNGSTWKELSNKIGISYYVIKGLLDKQSINLSHLIKILKYSKISDLEIIGLLDGFISNGKKIQFSFENSPDFSRFLGYLLAEGRLTESNQIWFTNGSQEIVEDYVHLVKKLFGKKPLICEYKQNCWDIIFYSAPLIKILHKLGVKENSGKKEISNTFLKHSSTLEIAQLLNGLYCGDGYVSKSSIELTTKSSKLAKGIEICLLRLGITSRIRKETKTIKSIHFSGEYYNVISYGSTNFAIFEENIKLVHNKKRQRIIEGLNKIANPNTDLIEVNKLVKDMVVEAGINIKVTKKQFPSLDVYSYNQCLPSRNGLQNLCDNLFINKTGLVNQLETVSHSDIFWDEIKEVNEVGGDGFVYDLCVDEHHNFIANNIYVHNSNISDALCFVLGRLSIKSIRAKKASNLIFQGTKAASPSKEAIVEIIFDNSEKAFTYETDEVAIKRIVRKNGQSIYKINNETKTRQDVLSLLAQAGIDPHGFNIILQNEIQNFVRMHPEERRGIIEEVSGISIYESSKLKSLKELDRTEERLKEVASILRERTSYLNNLEKERQQALKFKKLEKDVKVFKASIISFDLMKKKKHLETIDSEISIKISRLEKIKMIIHKIQSSIDNSRLKIASINKKIESSTGIEQELLNREIADIRAELAGLSVRRENFQSKIMQLEKQREDAKQKITQDEITVRDLNKEAPLAKKEKDLQKKKEEFEEVEQQRKKYYMLKSESKSLKERIREKEIFLQHQKNESEIALRQIDSLSSELFDKKSSSEKLTELKSTQKNKRESFMSLNVRERELEKYLHTYENEIVNLNKIVSDIAKLDVCPLCKSKITQDHISHIKGETSPKLKDFQSKIQHHDKELSELYSKKQLLDKDIEELSNEITKRESDINKIYIINEKKERIKQIQDVINRTNEEISVLTKRQKALDDVLIESSTIESKYESTRLELQEVSMRSEETLDSEMSFKMREIDRLNAMIKQYSNEMTDLKEDLESIKKDISERESRLSKKNALEQDLVKKNQQLIHERESINNEIRNGETEHIHKSNDIRTLEQDMNNLKIDKARVDAEILNLESEMLSYPNIPIIKTNKEALQEKLQSTLEILTQIGSVNLKSLEVYDEVKKEYDTVRERADLIMREKDGILKVVHEIDIKKRKAFKITLDALNEIFNRNFTMLSTKGTVSLELENNKDPFEGGVNVLVKTGHGKYFDVSSLSGGEQTIVALSLIFAIQEYKPYHFYILDEIDAALDKRNSERLADLLKKYMQRGQYIVITHNDEIITNATNIFGVSMHEGVSKIISLKL